MSPFSNAYSTLNRWFIFAGLIFFGLFIIYQQGLINLLINTDKSYISTVVLSVFVFACLHAGLQALKISKESAMVMQLTQLAKKPNGLIHLNQDGIIEIGGELPSKSFAHEHLSFVAEKNCAHGFMTGQDLLLDRLDNRIRRGYENGWFIADLMTKLGLLGTVIGFIYMLSSISTVSNVDLHAVQQLLTNMSTGMRVALYTTLTGLSAGILLSFQYQLLDQGADRLLSDIIELSEVHGIKHFQEFTEIRANSKLA